MSDNKKQPTQSPGGGSTKSDQTRRDISIERDKSDHGKITTVMDTIKPPPNNRGNTDNGKTDKSR